MTSTGSWADADDEIFDITPPCMALDKSFHAFINKPMPSDKYNALGQNITSQSRRQAIEPWTKVQPKRRMNSILADPPSYDNFKFTRGTTVIWSNGIHIYSNNIPF